MMRRVKKDFRIQLSVSFLVFKKPEKWPKLGELFVLDNNDGSL